MNDAKTLMDMIATEALEERLRNHYSNRFRNPKRTYEQPDDSTKPLTMRYKLELVIQPDGSLEWVE